MQLFDATTSAMQYALDARAAAQRIVAGNIANADTPGYTAQKVDFDQTMQQAMEGKGSKPVVVASTALPNGSDGNNVDLENELSTLEQNKLMYNVSAQVMAFKLRQISTVIDKDQF